MDFVVSKYIHRGPTREERQGVKGKESVEEQGSGVREVCERGEERERERERERVRERGGG